MELDELKLHLKQKLDAGQPAKSQGEITSMLKKNTLSVLGKIKRSLVFEIACAVAFILLCGAFAFLSQYWSMQVYFGIFTVVLLLFTLVLLYLLKRVNRVNSHPMPVKTNIETLYLLLKEFVKRYFQFSMALVPVCMVIAVWAGLQEPGRGEKIRGIFFDSHFTLGLFIVLYTAALAALVYFFTRWYLKKLYGNYLTQLEGLIKELEE